MSLNFFPGAPIFLAIQMSRGPQLLKALNLHSYSKVARASSNQERQSPQLSKGLKRFNYSGLPIFLAIQGSQELQLFKTSNLLSYPRVQTPLLLIDPNLPSFLRVPRSSITQSPNLLSFQGNQKPQLFFTEAYVSQSTKSHST